MKKLSLSLNSRNQKDCDEIVKLYAKSKRVDQAIRKDIVKSMQHSIKQMINLNQEVKTLSIRSNGKIVAGALFNESSFPNMNKLGILAVTPKYQGKGLGSRIIKSLIMTELFDDKHLIVEVHPDEYDELVGFYAQFGLNKKVGFEGLNNYYLCSSDGLKKLDDTYRSDAAAA